MQTLVSPLVDIAGSLTGGATLAEGDQVPSETVVGLLGQLEGARNLLALRAKLSPAANAACGALIVIVADSPTYIRPDGVLVTSIASWGP